MGCIYIATNVVNNKQYVGQTVADLARRRWAHENLSQHPERRGYGVFHRAIAKHGAYNFRWETLCLAEEHELNELEALAIEMNGTTLPRGYNMTTGGAVAAKLLLGSASIARRCYQSTLPGQITATLQNITLAEARQLFKANRTPWRQILRKPGPGCKRSRAARQFRVV